MPIGDQKQRVMVKRALDEAGYYAFAAQVAHKRHFNVRCAQLLQFYGLQQLEQLADRYQELPEDLPPEQEVDWLLLRGNCPMSLLRAYVQVGGDACADQSPWARISAGLCTTTEQSLRRWGDVNHLTASMLRRYCGAQGTPLDVQAMHLSHEALPVTEHDLVEFIVAHPRGQHTYRPRGYGHQLAEAFRLLTGFRLTYGFAVQLLARLSPPAAPIDACPF
ncbi:hypothetical protein GCM10027048_20400 [Hymenobacter coalescens]